MSGAHKRMLRNSADSALLEGVAKVGGQSLKPPSQNPGSATVEWPVENPQQAVDGIYCTGLGTQ